MSFDLNGIEPKSKVGEYFRNSCWYWADVWGYVCQNCQDILSEYQLSEGCINDGVEITAKQAELLANRLFQWLESGEPKKLELQVRTEWDNFPLKACGACEGTGLMEPADGEISTCIICGGKGEKHDTGDSNWKPFTEDNVKRFAEFCKDSGGFRIW
jgi:hypothetical protein